MNGDLQQLLEISVEMIEQVVSKINKENEGTSDKNRKENFKNMTSNS
jgi:hypothetical protein